MAGPCRETLRAVCSLAVAGGREPVAPVCDWLRYVRHFAFRKSVVGQQPKFKEFRLDLPVYGFRKILWAKMDLNYLTPAEFATKNSRGKSLLYQAPRPNKYHSWASCLSNESHVGLNGLSLARSGMATRNTHRPTSRLRQIALPGCRSTWQSLRGRI